MEEPRLPVGNELTGSDRADWLASRETWRPYPSRSPYVRPEPYSLEWFNWVERRRYSRHGVWIPKLLEFDRHKNEQVLCLGDGLGTDWVRYALGGAHVTVGSPISELLQLCRRQFDLRGLRAEFCHTPLSALPSRTDTVDVVCLSGLSGPLDLTSGVVDEIYRVLRPGGKLIAIVPALRSVGYWQKWLMPWVRFFQGHKKPSDQAYTSRKACELLSRFRSHQILKRHLRRSDLPHLWRWMLLPMAERWMGQFLVLKAFKPLTAGLTVSVAA